MKQKLYLIAYDIAEPRRLGPVARHLCKVASRVQYSVFVAQLSKAQLLLLLSELEEIIDPEQDDIRAYPLPASGDVTLIGEQFFLTNTLLVQNGHSKLALIQDSD